MLPIRILHGSAVYCKCSRQQKKPDDSFQLTPGFCADAIFIFAVLFDTDILLIDITNQ